MMNKDQITGSPATYETRLTAALVSFHQSLFDQKIMQLKPEFAETTACPVCNSSDAREVFEKDFFHYQRCNRCDMLYMNPRLNAEATVSFYNSDVNRIYNEKKFDEVSSATEIDDSFNIENLKILQNFISRNKLQASKLLEIGCAKGVFLKHAQQAGFQVEGLELNKENAALANSVLGANVVQIIDLFEMKYPSGSFDVVYMRDVIEHIHNPDPFLAEISRILKPGGIIYLETHNIDGLIYKIVGPRHTVIFGFEHPVHWSPKTLGLALSRHGMKLEFIGFKSIDFTLRNIVKYFLRPTFTTVFPPKIGPLKRFLLRVLNFVLSRPGIRQLDQSLIPQIANFLQAGSTMKVLAVKRVEQSK